MLATLKNALVLALIMLLPADLVQAQAPIEPILVQACPAATTIVSVTSTVYSCATKIV